MTDADVALWTELRQRLHAAREQTEREEYAEAMTTLTAVRSRCLSLGLRSAHLSWAMAVACDGLGRHEEALQHARDAVTLDPLALPYQRSLEIIAGNLAARLGRSDRPVDDTETPHLYELLLQHGAADADCHLAMARWHLHRGETGAAIILLEALTRLEPWRLGAWELLAHAALRSGQLALAQAASCELLVRRGREAEAMSTTPWTARRARWPRE